MVDVNMRVVEPRQLSLKSRFKFRCHPGVSCFTECCGKTTIILTPYDILRLVIMDMPRYEGRCPFVRPVTGCQVYKDRPASCRYYPIGQGTLITEAGPEEFYFYVREEHCRGYEEEGDWTVASWRADQGVDKYDEMNLEWKTMMLRRGADGGPVTDERGNNLFYMVMYDLDQFRRFVFETKFLQIFQVDEDMQQRIWEDDLELLKFGQQYVKTVLKLEQALKPGETVLKQSRTPNP
jgi:Fe-S-cluster containining protein